MNSARIKGLVLAFAGLVPAFFLVGPLVFADGSSGERALSLLIAAAIYVMLGAAAGYWMGRWGAGLWLGLPAVIVALRLGEMEALSLLTGCAVAGAACLGAWGGARIRGKQPPRA